MPNNFERCQTCTEPYADHVAHNPYNRHLGFACDAFRAYPRTHKPSVVYQVGGYRVRQPGEQVQPGDYIQIGKSYHLVDGSIWAGDIIEYVGVYSMVWTEQR
jgi:hypothetical protein